MHHQLSGASAGATTYAVSRGTVTAAAVIVLVGVVLQIVAPDLVDTLRSPYYWLPLAGAVLVCSIAFRYVQLQRAAASQHMTLPKMFVPIPFTLRDLQWYDGQRNSTAARMARGDTSPEEYFTASSPERLAAAVAQGRKLKHPLPLYDNLVFVGVKGVVYNVSPDYYGPGAGYSAFAAKDSSRQLGKVVVGTQECNADWTTMNDKHVKVLGDWESRFREKYCIAGWVVPEEREYFSRGTELAP